MAQTKGKWKVVALKKNTGYVVENGEHQICEIVPSKSASGLLKLPEHKSNARLIAAAPELLEALKHIAEYWNQNENDRAMNDALYHIIDTAEQAIAAAEGK